MVYLIVIVALGMLGMNWVKGSKTLMNKGLRMGLLLILDFVSHIIYDLRPASLRLVRIRVLLCVMLE